MYRYSLRLSPSRLAECSYLDGEIVLLDELVLPDDIKKLIFGHDLAAPQHKREQYIERFAL